jgi:hypothetical protein
MTNTANHAKRELEILSKFLPNKDNRPIVEPFKKEIIALCERFGKSGQSGGSAPYTAAALANTIKKLLLQESICPLTGIDEEWVDVAEIAGRPLYQNNREGGVFKEGKRAHYVDAISWKTPKGICYHSNNVIMPDGSIIGSVQYIKKFPFTPKTFYIDIIEEEVAKDDWVFYVKNEKQLEKVWKYYDRRVIKKKRTKKS